MLSAPLPLLAQEDRLWDDDYMDSLMQPLRTIGAISSVPSSVPMLMADNECFNRRDSWTGAMDGPCEVNTRLRLVRRENIPALPASDWSV
eukprot:1132035-Pyramimonas_sp.AAC.1